MPDNIFEWAGAIWGIITSLVTLASLIAALTPTPKDDEVLMKIRRVIETIALNFGNAKR